MRKISYKGLHTAYEFYILAGICSIKALDNQIQNHLVPFNSISWSELENYLPDMHMPFHFNKCNIVKTPEQS